LATTTDLLFIVLYLVFLVFVGLRRLKGDKKDIDEYLVMGRRLALPGFVASLVSTWYGGILGVGEYSYKYISIPSTTSWRASTVGKRRWRGRFRFSSPPFRRSMCCRSVT
jgi:hypothetical protein